jgi:DNA-binding beta-propeller fold protein YncE
MAFDNIGNLYVANSTSNTIEKFAPDGTQSLFASAGLNSPYGLAFDSVGSLYVSNFASNNIERFAPDGTHSLFSDKGLFGPYGLAFDTDGTLFAANIYEGPIMRFATDGTLLGQFVDSEAPTFIAFGPSIPERATPLLLLTMSISWCSRRRRALPRSDLNQTYC